MAQPAFTGKGDEINGFLGIMIKDFGLRLKRIKGLNLPLQARVM